jgi:hypothetical protein
LYPPKLILPMNIQRGIEYYYNGPEAETLKASFKELKRAAAMLRAGEHVMYINALTAPREVEEVADSVSKRHRGKVLTYSVTSTTFAARLQFISLAASAKNVRVIVLNSIDFAARTTNQKKALVHWLREMRDVLGCRVVVYGMFAPTDTGAIAQLKYVTSREVRFDQWSQMYEPEVPGLLNCHDVRAVHPSEAAKEFIAEISALPEIEEEVLEDVEFVDEEGVISRSRHVDFSAIPPLEINDLAGAGALRAIRNYELGIRNGEREFA